MVSNVAEKYYCINVLRHANRSIIYIILQLNSSTQLNLTYCEASHTGKLLDEILLQTELGAVTFFLAYLGYKNSRIKDLRYREEGQSVARFGMACSIVFLTLFLLFGLSRDYKIGFPRIMELFWVFTIMSTVTPVVLFSVVFLPKVSLKRSRRVQML